MIPMAHLSGEKAFLVGQFLERRNNIDAEALRQLWKYSRVSSMYRSGRKLIRT